MSDLCKIALCITLLVFPTACTSAPVETVATPKPLSTKRPISQPTEKTVAPPSPFPTVIPDQLEKPTSNTCYLELEPCVLDGHFLLVRPIASPDNNGMDSGYLFGSTQGERRIPHHGVEFQNPTGTPVLAAVDGDVVVAGNDTTDLYSPWTEMYGNLVILAHDLPEVTGTVYTLYAHLSQIDVMVGQHVDAGDPIGRVGLTGAAIGSHLHFEVRLGENSYTENRNPALWLESRPGQGVLAGRVVDSAEHPVHVTIRVQYYPERSGEPVYAYQVETYAPEQFPVKGDDVWQENFAVGDLPSGWYRITLVRGKVIEYWAEVLPDKLTMVLIEIE